MLFEKMTVGTRGRTRRVASGLFVLALLVVGPLAVSTPALAGQLAKSVGRKAPSGAGYITFGIEPSGPREPDQRTWFIYTLKPGTTIEDWVAVTNFSLVPLRINLYARDAEESPTGAFGVQLFRQRPVQVGSWIHLPVSSVLVDPRKAIIVPFTIKVPQDASVGDNAGGIIASVTRTASGAHGTRIRVEQRVGVRVYIRIAGALHPKLVISGLVSHYAGTLSPLSGGTLTVTYTVRNLGNLDLSAPSVLRLTNPFGWSRTVQQSGSPPDVSPRILRPGHPRHTRGLPSPAGWHQGHNRSSLLDRLDRQWAERGISAHGRRVGQHGHLGHPVAAARAASSADPRPRLGHLHPFPATSRRPATARGGAPRGGSARMTREEPNT